MGVKRNESGEITFVCNPPSGTKKVFLAGDFNDWRSDARRMVKLPDGSFRAKVQLEQGAYAYKFIMDGEWCTDPDAEGQASDGFGGMNSIVHV